jgi:8-oxo-dGTP pyrophosphatase MutT (NUDIX family)
MSKGREGVAVLFVNRRGEVLLRLRSDDPNLAFPNQWDTIGGAVEPGESHEDAAIRETAEEIGLDLRGYLYWRDYQSVVLLHIYAASLDLTEGQIELTEGQRVGWFDLRSAAEKLLHPWVAAMLPEFMASDFYSRLAGRTDPVKGGETRRTATRYP